VNEYGTQLTLFIVVTILWGRVMHGRWGYRPMLVLLLVCVFRAALLMALSLAAA
jgi:hypothetical protein